MYDGHIFGSQNPIDGLVLRLIKRVDVYGLMGFPKSGSLPTQQDAAQLGQAISLSRYYLFDGFFHLQIGALVKLKVYADEAQAQPLG